MTSVAIAEHTINVPFHGTNLFLVSINNEPYVPMKPVVEGMGMVWAAQFVKLKQRFVKGISEIEIPSAGGKQLMICLAFRKFAAWLSSIQPNKVRPEIRDKVIQYQEECDDVLYEYWTKGKAENPRKKTSVDERTPLRDAVNMLVSKKHLMYPEAYAMIHQRFNVESIEELEASQIPLAVEYIHRVVLEGEFIGKQEKKTNDLSAKEANSLVWLWDYANRSQALFRELYPAMRQIQSNYSGKCYDYGHEFSYIIGIARDVLINHTRDVDINEPDGPTNLSAWMRLKDKELPPSLHRY
ncbi:phage antirepressor Ant [Salmonella enterica]|uniref:phage antirepressor N-terminal domain-containing protein n=1 Tax=Salmonella enterica TaxID=28901 RepID=UPI00069AD34A|nr:phage antirepressor N-terminal domain-containing protein [Salmonella enterica]EAM4270640.1 phage antirepressor Ant [Salmonella enterica subsp. enterica serovar Muenchen]EAO6012172.1 phage antirepressor Ant [Salmonella enterica subsp. enterica serovar Bere]EDC4374046.1 phage antirepressor Ant [Salmonella enterica subsp. enterica]EJV7324986.1 phage antirepressor Ant [Salmonella enterica subsp. enterica serovar Altona]EKG8165753.1 phage antirepressor Ant [Salmonella enterica subsp. enterica se